MANTTVTLELPEGLWKDIDFAAFGQAITPAELIARVMHDYLDEEDRLAVEEGNRAIEAGEVVEHEEVLRWLEEKRLRAIEAA